ncbi:signal peptidase I [Bdellovibrionota bacterium FG-1]
MRPSTRKIFRDYGIAIFAAVIVALFIRGFIIEAYRIPTPAMRPTLEPGDTIFVLKWPIGFDRKVKAGDVVIFAGSGEPPREYIKRVVGLAGDLIEVRKGRVSLNGKPLAAAGDRPLAPCGQEIIAARTYPVCWEQPLVEDFGPEKVPDGSVFVIGDLRTQSPSDLKKRRSWGMIRIENIKGRAQWIWLSIQPSAPNITTAHFPTLRLDRMFRRIE